MAHARGCFHFTQLVVGRKNVTVNFSDKILFMKRLGVLTQPYASQFLSVHLPAGCQHRHMASSVAVNVGDSDSNAATKQYRVSAVFTFYFSTIVDLHKFLIFQVIHFQIQLTMTMTFNRSRFYSKNLFDIIGDND